MIGIVEDKDDLTTLGFKNEGDLIYLVGENKNDISSSEYLYSYHKVKNTPAPYFDLEEEFKVQQGITSLIKKRLLNSAHDVSDGGLFICLLESAMVNNLGFEIQSQKDIRKDAFLFGEAQGRVVVSISPATAAAFEAELAKQKVPFTALGKVRGASVMMDSVNYGEIAGYRNLYDTSIESYL
jgi:phosphoribosylformylglycinamidine synthase